MRSWAVAIFLSVLGGTSFPARADYRPSWTEPAPKTHKKHRTHKVARHSRKKHRTHKATRHSHKKHRRSRGRHVSSAPYSHVRSPQVPPPSGGMVTIPTVAGRITVARSQAPHWQALIADLAAAGYRPHRLGCYASGGHVTYSRHYVGAACDFDGSLSRSAFMRSQTAHRIIVAHGFRNGCSFAVHGVRDCGHVDDGRAGHRHNWYTLGIRMPRFGHRRRGVPDTGMGLGMWPF